MSRMKHIPLVTLFALVACGSDPLADPAAPDAGITDGADSAATPSTATDARLSTADGSKPVDSPPLADASPSTSLPPDAAPVAEASTTVDSGGPCKPPLVLPFLCGERDPALRPTCNPDRISVVMKQQLDNGEGCNVGIAPECACDYSCACIASHYTCPAAGRHETVTKSCTQDAKMHGITVWCVGKST